MFRQIVSKQRLFSTATLPDRYAKPLIILHWLQAISVIGAIGSVNYAMRTPKTPEGNKQKGDAMFMHKSFGAFVFGTLPIRILVRLANPTPAHLPSPKLIQLAASLGHLGLYGGLAFMATTGVAMAYASGKGLPFFFTTIQFNAPADGPSAKYYYGIHKQFGFWWQFLVPLHVAGAGFHFAQGQRIFSRMNPFL